MRGFNNTFLILLICYVSLTNAMSWSENVDAAKSTISEHLSNFEEAVHKMWESRSLDGGKKKGCSRKHRRESGEFMSQRMADPEHHQFHFMRMFHERPLLRGENEHMHMVHDQSIFNTMKCIRKAMKDTCELEDYYNSDKSEECVQKLQATIKKDCSTTNSGEFQIQWEGFNVESLQSMWNNFKESKPVQTVREHIQYVSETVAPYRPIIAGVLASIAAFIMLVRFKRTRSQQTQIQYHSLDTSLAANLMAGVAGPAESATELKTVN